jgi:hypothetical protein
MEMSMITLIETLINREGSANKLSRKLKYDPAYICRVRQGKYPFGKDLARRIKQVYPELKEQVNRILVEQALRD